MKYRTVFIAPESLMHARTHKYIDKIWKNGKWNYIYHDPTKPIDPSSIKQPVSSQNATASSSKSKSKAKKSSSSKAPSSSTQTVAESSEQKQEVIKEKGRKFVRTYLGSAGFGNKTIDSGAYIKEDSSGREYYYTRNRDGRLVKKYLK